MRSAVDTNILVRLVVGDDPRQLASIQKALPAAGTLVISNVVLCELVWVLVRFYKRRAEDIAQALQAILEIGGIEIDAQAVEAGLAMMRQGGDFSDGVVLLEARHRRCDQLLTFDKDFARIGGRVPVNLI